MGSVEESGRAFVELWVLEEGAVALGEEEEEEEEDDDEEPFCKEPVGLREDVMGEAGGLVRTGSVVVFSSALSLMVMRFVDGFPEGDMSLEVGLFAEEEEEDKETEDEAGREEGLGEGLSKGLCDNAGEGEEEEEGEEDEAAEAAARRWEISLV